jgi:voltage-gated potassium channel
MPDAPEPTRIRKWAARRLEQDRLRPRDAAYIIGLLWFVAVVVFGVIERIVDPKTFPTVWLAFWWAIQTVTTVGYGDVVPSQTLGKVLATILMLGGLSLLSIVTATITSAFVARRQAAMQAAGEDPIALALEEMSTRLDSIESQLRGIRAEPDPDG